MPCPPGTKPDPFKPRPCIMLEPNVARSVPKGLTFACCRPFLGRRGPAAGMRSEPTLEWPSRRRPPAAKRCVALSTTRAKKGWAPLRDSAASISVVQACPRNLPGQPGTLARRAFAGVWSALRRGQGPCQLSSLIGALHCNAGKGRY